MTSASIIRTPNTNHLDQPGRVDWHYGAPDGEATADEHDAAIATHGAGWHTLTRLCERGMTGRDLFRLLRADSLRYVGDDAVGDPVYMLMF